MGEKKQTSGRHGAVAGVLLGGLLGLGAPLGSLALRLVLAQTLSPQAAIDEVQGRLFFYLYMTLSTPVVFATFGFYLGLLRDRLAEQNVYLSRMNRILERQSMLDEVTGLANRRFLEFEIEREIARAQRRGSPIAGLMIDIDDFKAVNDRYGHLTGDAVLAHVASVLQRSIRKADITGRYGGDEFLVILPEANLPVAERVAARIQRNIHIWPIEAATQIEVTVSIGLFAFADASALDKKAFIERIDLALLKAKQAGKDRIVSG